MVKSQRPFWNYPLFQIPLMFFGAFLVAAALFWLLGIGRPQVAVAIALDLSNSTHEGRFNAPGTVMYQEVQAVQAYLDKNGDILRQPNAIKVLGFGGVVVPLTNEFNTNSGQVKNELTTALNNPNLAQQVVPETTNITDAIDKGTTALQGVENRCRELIVVTDGEAPVAPQVVANAIAQRVKINSIVIGAQAPLLLGAATTTGGKYISGRQENLEALFTDTFFGRFNSNLKWIIFWLGMAWIALMWLITMPLDRWVFQGIFKLHWSPAGKFALFHALFWTALTPAIVWRLTQLVGGLPFFGGC